MVMAGKSRLVYHAVPRVLAPNEDQQIPSCLERDCNTTAESISKTRQETGEISVSIYEEKIERNSEQFRDERETLCKRARYEEVTDDNGRDSFICSSTDTTETRLIRQYLSSSRININIRQVLAEGQAFPSR